MTLDIQCFISLIHAISRIALSQTPHKLADYIPLNAGKLPAKYFAFSGTLEVQRDI